MVSERTIGRLSTYRRLLNTMYSRGVKNIFSHQLAEAARMTAAQVRRDVMSLGYTGSTVRGYNVEGLIGSIRQALDNPEGEKAALVGLGKLGRAILAYFAGRRPKLKITAAFDRNRDKAGQILHGCRCYHVSELAEVTRAAGICVAIITVPASAAQSIADELVRAGVRGILNFAPLPLQVPPDVYVEGMDVTMALEKVAYFARHGRKEAETVRRSGDG